MAWIQVNSYIDIGTGGNHEATSWQFAKDKDFTLIIDESIEDRVNVKKWHSMLPKRPEDKTNPDAEEYYSDLDELWARCKIHVGETVSDWYVIGPRSQRLQKVLVTDQTADTEAGEPSEYMSDSTLLGWTDTPIDHNDPNILGPIIRDPEEEEPEEELPEDPGTDEELPEELPDEEVEGSGTGGDPIFPEDLPDVNVNPDGVVPEDTEEEGESTEEFQPGDVILPDEGPEAQESNPEGTTTPETDQGDAEQESGSQPEPPQENTEGSTEEGNTDTPPSETEQEPSGSVEPEQTEKTEDETTQVPEDSSTETPPSLEDTGDLPGGSEPEQSMGTPPVQPESTEDSEKNR